MKRLVIKFCILAVLVTAGTVAVSYDLASNIFKGRQAVTREYVLNEEYTGIMSVRTASIRPENKTVFLLGSEYGKVVVYNENRTVHDYTEIRLSRLPRKLQIAILNTYRIEGESSLYDFLETYSS